MVKPHGFVLDFVGIFDKLEKALAFDSEEVNAIVKDLKLLKVLFENKMESKAPEYLGLIERNFNDKDVDTLIEHFRDPERRKEFFKEYKEIEMLYEIISPDAFLRPFIDALQHAVGHLRRGAKCLYQDEFTSTGRFRRKPTSWCRNTSVLTLLPSRGRSTWLLMKTRSRPSRRSMMVTRHKVINLIKSISKTAEEHSDDPYLIALADRAQAVQEGFEKRQTSTQEALEELFEAPESE